MLDGQGRTIDYVRISVTDRCDLRCVYCMPEEGVELVEHGAVLRYEEIVRIVALLARLGVKKVRLTGGEPLVRKGLPSLIEQIKGVPGIERVVLTTNGMLLSKQLDSLVSAGLDGLNISLDAIDEEAFHKITRRSGVKKVLRSIDDVLARQELTVKLNCVPTELNRTQILPMAERFLHSERLALRFIELMPIGLGKGMVRIPESELKTLLAERFGELMPLENERLSGPCRYFRAEGYPGRLGFISAVSDCFCAGCNRVRLTSGGFLKTCLQFNQGVELRPLLTGCDEDLLSAMQEAIWQKPERHLFMGGTGTKLEGRIMSQIGG